MRKILIAAAGKDRPGIVAAFTEVLFESKCNLEDTSMTTLEDHFAMLFIVQAPDSLRGEELELNLQCVSQKFGLHLSLHSIETDSVQKLHRGLPWIVSVIGPDKTGIVFHVAQILARYEGNICQLSSRRLERGTEVLFSMNIELELPDRVSSESFTESLAALAASENLEVHAEPLEEYNL